MRTAWYLWPFLILALVSGCSKGDAELEVSPSKLDFGETETQKQISIKNCGNDGGIFKSGVRPLDYELDPNANWISVQPSSGRCEKNETDRITVTVSRSLLSVGSNSTTIDVSSNGGGRTVRVAAYGKDPVPDAPTLSAPDSNSTISDNTPDLDWSDPAHAYRYELIVDNNSSFTSPEIHDTDLTTSSYTPSSSLSDDAYYWKVRAKNSSGSWGNWSITWTFIVNASSSLSGGKVSPGGGTITDMYTYTVIFTDPLNNAPHTSQVVVDGNPYTMTKISGAFTSGATYRYQTTLAEGSHTYRFQFQDSRDSLLHFPAQSYETGPIVTNTTTIVYDSSTVLVDEQDSLSLASVSASVYTYTYTGLPPDIQVGDIILSTDAGGYLRKVTSKTVSGNQLILDTDQASLAEAFTRIVFDTTITLRFDGSSLSGRKPWGRQPYLAPGVQIRDGKLDLDGKILFDGFVNGTQVSIKIVSGSFGFEPSLDFDYDIGLLHQEVHAIASGILYLNVKPEIEASAGFSKSDEVLIAYLPIPLEWATIPASIDFSLYAGYEVGMDIAGEATFDMSGQTTDTVGFRYEDGDFNTVWETDSDWSAESPVWDAEGNAHAKVYLRPEISIKVIHIAGPYVDVLPYLDFEGAVTSNPYCWEWGIYAGLEANVGLELDIFVTSKSFSKQLFSAETQLAGDEDCPPDEIPPDPVDDLAAGDATSSSINLTWKAPGDDGNSGTVSQYDIRYSTSTITESNWNSATQCSGEPTPQVATSSESFTVTDLSSNTTYYFGIKTADEVPNWSGLSNVPSGKTEPGDSTTVTDIDGNVYKTIKIGNQWWMAENLKVTHYRNGDPIPNVTDNSAWSGLSTGAYCNHDNNEINVDTYGRLYNWYAVVDSRNIAPAGWHVPTDAEWQTLVDYLGGSAIAGGKMKEAGTTHWYSPNTGATNESGFTALPGGWRDMDGYFSSLGGSAYFWSSTEYDTSTAEMHILYFKHSSVNHISGLKRCGLSVRCVRD